MKGRRRTTIFRPGLMSNLIIYYKLINYKCMDNIMKCTPLGIIVRNRTNISLCRDCLRVTIGTRPENDMLLEALKNYEC